MREQSGIWNDLVPRVDRGRCRGCADCPAVSACLAQAIRRDAAGGPPWADANLCFACYSCAASCPWGAIQPPKRGK